MKKLITLIVCLCLINIVQAQSKPDTIIYFNLSTVKYGKAEANHVVQLKTKRNVHVYTFTIPCKCIAGTSVGFDGHDNPETGDIYDPIKKMSAKEESKMHFLTFDELIAFLQTHVNKNSYKLYFIENQKGIYYQYQVKVMGNFFEE